jgi:hypothetical protein
MNQIIQGSPEWFAQRVGKATASRIADIIAKTKTDTCRQKAHLSMLAFQSLVQNGAQ